MKNSSTTLPKKAAKLALLLSIPLFAILASCSPPGTTAGHGTVGETDC